MKLWEPTALKGIPLANRVVRSATNEHLSHRDGTVSEAYIQVYEALVRSGVGLIITSHMAADAANRADETQICVNAPGSAPGLSALAERVHRAGGRIVAQLSHAGATGPEAVNGHPPLAPSDLDAARAMTLAEIHSTVDHFVSAAGVIQRAGFDGVQIHLAHGYLLSEFLDPHFNRRTDAYGGSVENRYRVVGEILAGVRAACGPDFPVLVKLNATDVAGDPAFLDDQLQVCRALERDGADAIEVSGHGFATYKQEAPYFLSQALAIKEAVSLPVLLVGGFRDAAGMEGALARGIDYVSLSRPFISEPDFMEQLKSGARSRCVNCNGCFKVYRTQFKRCALDRGEVPQLRETFG